MPSWRILILILAVGLAVTFLTPAAVLERPPYNLETLDRYDVPLARADLLSGQYDCRRLRDALARLRKQEKATGFDSDLAFYHEALGVPENADAILKWTLKDPRSVDAWVLLGCARLRQARDLASRTAVPDMTVALREEHDLLLTQALEAFKKARKADRKDIHSYAGEIAVCRAWGKPREEMEGFFAAAVKLRPSSLVIRVRKAEALLSQWKEEFEGFVVESVRGAPMGSGMDLLKAMVHRERAVSSGEGMGYYRRPEVLSELKRIYEMYLRLFPQRYWVRSEFMRLCYGTEDYETAVRHIDALDLVIPEAWKPGGWESEEALREAVNFLNTQRGTSSTLLGAVPTPP